MVLGSVIDMATVDRCNALIDDALAKGARLLCGGKAEGDADAGHAARPRHARYAHLPARNRSGPSSRSSASRATRRRSRAPTTTNMACRRPCSAAISRGRCGSPNASSPASATSTGPTVHDEAQMPFGGVKGSGFGRFGGKAGIAEFTDLRWITLQNNSASLPVLTATSACRRAQGRTRHATSVSLRHPGPNADGDARCKFPVQRKPRS